MNQTKFHNQCACIPKYMIRGYPTVHTNPKSKRCLGMDDISQNERNEGTLMEILD